MHAPTEEEFHTRWEAFKEVFSNQKAIVSYLENTYVPYTHEFALWSIKNYLNFGIRATSRTESSHAELKRYLRNRLCDLRQLLNAIQAMMMRRKERYESQLAKEKMTRLPVYTRIMVLSPLCLKISFKALELLYQQYQTANEFFTRKRPRNEMRRCTHTFRRQMGLPCSHDVLERLESGETFTMGDINPHWHLKSPTPNLRNRLQEPDPLPVPTRGRPRNGPIFSSQSQVSQNSQGNRSNSVTTTRIPSHDEAPRSRGGARGGRGARGSRSGRGGRGGVQRPSSASSGRGATADINRRVTRIEGMIERLVAAWEHGNEDRQD